MTDFKKKAELFNLLFAEQCFKTDNSSEIPLNIRKKTIISAITFSCDNIATLIKNLDHSKAHGHMITICMLRLCGKSVCKSLNLFFNLV